MMLAGQAVLGGIGQDVAHHAAQGLLGENVVADMVRGHRETCRAGREIRNLRDANALARRTPALAFALIQNEWRLLLPGASEPRLTELNPSGL